VNDDKLLELAAKTVGAKRCRPGQSFSRIGDGPSVTTVWSIDGEMWEPLQVDGDAFRLMVKLHLTIDSHSEGLKGVWVGPGVTFKPEIVELFGTDPYAATRRAIVRAAADIGGTML